MYIYTIKSLLDNPVSYSYSSYEGDNFIKNWLSHRLSHFERVSKHFKSNNKKPVYPSLPDILYTNGSFNVKGNEDESCNFLLGKYESSKKLYSQYINNKPIKINGYKNIDNYVSTALMMETYYSYSKDIRYLNCLLKLCDLFQSDEKFFYHSYYLKELLPKEIDHIKNLISEKSSPNLKNIYRCIEQTKTFNTRQVIKGLTLLCCESSRSSIYLQALINANIYPENIVYMNNNQAKNKDIRYNYEKLYQTPDWLFIPKEYIHPIELAKDNKINLIQVNTSSVNSNIMYENLKKIKIQLIIYCGFGGEIVSQKLLDEFKFIHCHAGSLPKYRGSTTFYYEILNKQSPSVSCILLDKKIDTGPIIDIKSFPLPFKTDNIDTLYEPCIRANLLCDVIFNSGISLNLKSKVQTCNEDFSNYYIIHPILKHISYSLFRETE